MHQKQNSDQESNNLFFFDEDQDVSISQQAIKESPKQDKNSSFYRSKKQQLVGRQKNINAIGRNMFQEQTPQYEDYSKMVIREQPKKQMNKKQIIYQPGIKKNKNKEPLPSLKKHNAEVKQQIKYEKKKQQKKEQIQDDDFDIIEIPLGDPKPPKKQQNIFQQKMLPQQNRQKKKQQINKFKEKQQIQEQQYQNNRFSYQSEINHKDAPIQQAADSQDQGNQHQNLPTHNNEQFIVNTNNISPKIISISQIPDRKVFLGKPIPKGMVLQCTVKRDKSGFGRFFPHYDLYVSEGLKYLMSAKRRAGNTTSNYVISSDKNDMESKGPNFVGKVRSNFVGTQFFVYDDGANPEKLQYGKRPRKTLAEMYYESNFFGSKGPRKMTCFVPNVQKPPKVDAPLKSLYESQTGQSILLINKPPKWNEQMRAYVLNFNGRVDKPSVKNFILIKQNEQQQNLLLFGRVGEDVFNVDVQYPLSPLQAFGIILTSFDYKIACQ